MEDKKKKTTKKEVKKKVINKKEKNAVPNPEPFVVKLKRFVSSYKFLYAAFGVLLVLVLVLGGLVFGKSLEKSPKKSNIVFSILEENTHNYIELDLAGLVENDYILKVTNYRQNKLNEKGAKYTLTITNETDVEIEILKDNKGENLMTDHERSVIEGETFSKTEKEQVLYYIRVKDAKGLKDGDKIRIEVES